MTTPTGFKFYKDTMLVDFSDVFEPGNSAITTGFKSGATDLGNLFANGNSGYTTNYKNSIGTDLGSLFLKKLPFNITGGTYTTTSLTQDNFIIYNIVVEVGTSTLTFYETPTEGVNFQLVGGGGGGGGSWSNTTAFTIYSGAGGGGGGNLLVNNFQALINTPYIIAVGSGGAGGLSDDTTNASYTAPTPGSPGNQSSITGTGITLISYGGAGGNAGTSNTRAIGGAGGNYSSNIGGFGGLGGSGGQGNAGGSGTYNTGTDGTSGYLYINSFLLYSNSTSFPTYYKPPLPNYPYANVPVSITLSNWYTVSGGGGGANSTNSTQLASGNGGSGVGSGGLDGGNWSTSTPITVAPPYASFGGGGGGGGYLTPAFPGGNGLVNIWFTYILSSTEPFNVSGNNVIVGYTANYKYAIFLEDGQVTPIYPNTAYSTTLNFIVVGGGGGGGRAKSGVSNGGGGGGGAYLLSANQNTSYDISIGAGGAGGNPSIGDSGISGGISQVFNINNNTFLVRCMGGTGGTNTTKGYGGNVYINNDAVNKVKVNSIDITGGDGGDDSSVGLPCTYNTSGLSLGIYSELITAQPTYISDYYSGGGGGGKGSFDTSNYQPGGGGGTSPPNSVDSNTGLGGTGSFKDSTPPGDGLPGNGYGSGGGAGGNASNETRYNGGNGRQGIVIVYASL